MTTRPGAYRDLGTAEERALHRLFAEQEERRRARAAQMAQTPEILAVLPAKFPQTQYRLPFEEGTR